MTARLERPATQDRLFLWVMHRFSEVFEEHAIIKGGMMLRLLDSPRYTTDIDYVFVPFTSKNDIANRIEAVLQEIEGAVIKVTLHSRMLRADLRVDDAAIQIEASVGAESEAISMGTGGFANAVGHPSQVVRIMSLPHALAHKIAAWNERRLLRDLYDCYFLANRAGARPDLEVLDARLARIESRLPDLQKTRRMSREQLISEMRDVVASLSDADVQQQLAGILPPEELAGLPIRIRTTVEKLAELLGL